MELDLVRLTSPEAKALIDQGIDTAVFPVGAVEQHGPHGPLGTDGLLSRYVARKVAEQLNALCLPPLWFGVSSHHMDFSGSLTLRPEVLAQVIEDVLNSTIHHGIRKILILNGHGGNTAAIHTACTHVRNRLPEVFLAQSSLWLALHDVYHELPAHVRQESWRFMVAHAGYLETSMLMALDKDLVKLDKARKMPIEPFVQASDPALSVTVKMKEMSACGSGGDPTVSDAETGRMFLEKTVAQITGKYSDALAAFHS